MARCVVAVGGSACGRVLASNHAHGTEGTDACKQGHVWREAFRGDHVWVAPQVRDQAAIDKRDAPHRMARGEDAL